MIVLNTSAESFQDQASKSLNKVFLMVPKFLNSEFVNSMTDLVFSAWNSFVLVVKNFLENFKAENYKELVVNMFSNFRDIGAKMSIKIYYLFSHLDCFPTNLGDYGEEQSERFHQDFKTMEERY